MAVNPSPNELADQAKRTYQGGDYIQAAQIYARAANSFTTENNLAMAAEMKNNQSVALLLGGEAQSALEVVQGTELIFAETGDFRRLGMSLANKASALQALKRIKEAIEAYKGAADALDKAREGDLRAEVMQLLSMLYLRRFKFYDAVITLQSGLAGVKNPNFRQRVMKKVLFVRL